jgi:hypothetical protein
MGSVVNASPAAIRAVPRGGKNIVVLGTPEHEGRIAGRAFELLDIEPVYMLAGLPRAFELAPAPDLLFVTREWSRGIRVTVARARRRGIPVVYLMDGVVEWSYVWNNQSYIRNEGTVVQPLLASHLCVIGRHQARILAGLGLSDRVHLVGIPRLDDLDRHRVIDSSMPPKVLITTARTAAHNVEQKTSVRRALRDLRTWFDAHPSVQPVWRISPELALEMNLPLDSSESILATLKTAQALISFTSTTLLEGMLMGVPTIQVDYRPVPQYVQTAWEIRSPEHLDNVLHSALHPAPERLAFQDWCLDEELEAGNASARLADVIRAAIDERSGPRRESSESTTSASHYGRLDYRQVHSQLSVFAVSPMSVLQYELDATSNLLDVTVNDVVRLRTEAGELVEKVQYLKRELAASRDQHDAQVKEITRERAEFSRQRAEFAKEREQIAKERQETSRERAQWATAREASESAHRRFLQRVYIDRLQPVLNALRKAKVRKVTIYGGGDVGRALILACRAVGITVIRVVDGNSALWGGTLEGVPVTSADRCRSDRDRVFVLASFFHAKVMRADLRKTLQGKKVRIFAPARWEI